MKEGLFTLFFILLLLPLTAQEVEVPESQRPLITKKTATWCPFCGAWGWTMMEGLLDDNIGKALVVAAHYSGDLVNPTANAIISNFGGFSQPRFFYNNVDQGASSSSYNSVRESIKSKVISDNATSPQVQTGLVVVDQEDQLRVYTKTRFFDNVSGEYSVGVYLIEKSVINNQAGNASNAEHRQVIRETLTTDHFGEIIGNGSINAGTEVEFSVDFPLDGTYDLYNIEIATIIWKKEDNTYQVVNTNFTDDIMDDLVGTNKLEVANTFAIQPNPVENTSLISIEISKTVRSADLHLYNSLGQLVANLYQGSLQDGIHQFELNRSITNTSGVYLLRFRMDGQVQTRRVVFR